MLLEGLHIPLTTPFFADGRLNLRKLEANVAHYSLTPAAGLVALGEVGEATLLSDEETARVLLTVAKAAAATKVLLAGVWRDSVAGSLALIESAAAMGYDVAVVRAPVFAGMGAKERRLYLEVVADGSALPIVLAGGVTSDVVSELAHHPRVLGWARDFSTPAEVERVVAATAGVKRTVEVTAVFAAVTGRMAREPEGGLLPVSSLTGGGVSALAGPRLKTRAKTVGFQLLGTRTERLLACLSAGAVGAALPLAAAAPQACYEVMAAWKDGDQPLAEEKQQRLTAAARLIEGRGSVAALKHGCDLNGYAGGVARLPLLPPTGEERAVIAASMADLRA